MRGMEGLISITYLFRVSNVTYSYYPLFYPNPNIESILMSLLILFFGQFFFGQLHIHSHYPVFYFMTFYLFNEKGYCVVSNYIRA